MEASRPKTQSRATNTSMSLSKDITPWRAGAFIA
jgi:hypothetical protein